jgi:HEAT repeat protein
MSLDEEAIAEKLAELEPTWAGRPNVFTREIAANDVESISARLGDSLPAVRGDAAEALGQLKSVAALPKLGSP